MLTDFSAWPISLQFDHDSNTSPLVLEKSLRYLPGKRLTASGKLQGKPVIAKLYLDPNHSKRHWTREQKGITALQKAGITTPALLFSGQLTDQIPVLILEQLPAAETALDVWHNLTDDKKQLDFMCQLLTELATHHQAGLLQTDLHLNNFLHSLGIWYTIDADTINS
ncbi:MAG: hypothetical protein KAU22_05280, partial [Desulfuromonadales bacterium]|nr:hypothetical protein [Desulfuromonadales bacterium]